MKNMKKIIIFCLIILTGLTVKAQLNPVNNLYWSTDFSQSDQSMCDTLSWNKPAQSLTDTLIGYNIYQNNILYEFTTDTLHTCHGCLYDFSSSFCFFIGYSGHQDFYIHVTAVYNLSHTESDYNDSIYWNFNMWPIGIKEMINTNSTISSIIQSNSSIMIKFTQSVNNGTLILSNYLGQKIYEMNFKKEENEINFNSPDSGLYFLSLMTNKDKIVRKIIIK
jgi:hypothetical protein